MTANAPATLLGALAVILRALAQVFVQVIHPVLRAYYDHQSEKARERLARAVGRGDLDGARHARRRLLDLKAARERLR